MFQLTYFPRASLGRASFLDTAKVIHHNQNPAGTEKLGKKEEERRNDLGDPLQHFLPAWDLSATAESHARRDSHASETPTILCRVSTELPHKPSLALSQTQQEQLSSSLAEHSKGSR